MNQSHRQLSDSSGPAPIDLRRLQVFVSSATHLSFAACAQQLNLTPSAVSHAIRSLEEELSCVLFQRHGPRVTLSRAGIRLFPVAEDLLTRAQGIRGEISSVEDESRQLKVGVPEFLCADLFPKVMPDFFECFPSFAFEIVLLTDLAAAANALDDRNADLVISIRKDLQGDTVRRGLFNCEFEFFVAPFHRLAGFTRIESSELSNHRLLIPHESVHELLKSSGLLDGVPSNRLWILPSVESVREFARVGMGVAVLVRREGSSPQFPLGLQALSCSWPRIEATCSAFWPGQNQLSWAAEAFLSFVEMVDDL
ncbi:LysR family transcriptional regulator [Haloferula sp.]|uniref:LysR family transcriptional regulator n=1 Tax=Haloferula sp. TaxID=2497595 RepID=UPI003C73D663